MPNANSGRRRPAAYGSSSEDLVSEEDRFDDSEDEGNARVPVRGKTTRSGKAARATGGGGFFSQALVNQSEDGPISPQQATTAKSSTGKATTTRKRQSKITDSPAIKKAASSKPATSTKHVVIDLDPDSEEESLFTPKKATNTSSKFAASRKKQSKITDSPALKKAASSKASTSSKHTLIDLDPDDEAGSSFTAKKASNKPSPFTTSRKKQSKITDAPALKKAAASKLASSSQPSKPAVIDVDSDSDEPSLFTPKKGRPSASTKPVSTDDTDSDDVILPSTRRSAVKSATARGTKRAAPTDDTDSDDVILPINKRGAVKRPVPMDTDDSDVEIQPATRCAPAKEASARNTTKRAAPTDSESDAIVRPAKRGRFVRKESSASGTASEAEPQGTTPPRSSLAKTPSSRRRKDPKSEKKRQMELLRRRRAGETINEEDLTSEEEEEQGALYDSDSDHLALSTFEDDDEGVPGNSSPAKKAGKKKLMNSKGKGKAVPSDDESEKSGDSDDDFVVDDPEGEIGIPDDAIPLEFTSFAQMDLKHYFPFVVEWIVQSKIYPDFPDRQADHYRMSWNKLNDLFGGLVYSKFISTAWKPGFIHALKARPELVAIEKEPSFFPDDICMACERGNHQSSWIFIFSGSAYYKNSSSPRFLEDVPYDPDDDEDDEDGEAEGERDEDNNRLPPASKQWNLGSTCQSNAETAHTLIHWKWSLASLVHERLETQRYLSPKKLAKREKMDGDQKANEVRKIMDKWREEPDEGKSMMDSLFDEFKRQRELAINKSTTGGRGGQWAR
jgi:hypothetical protein